jgi:pantoate kinase
LVYAGMLMREGLSSVDACTYAISQTLTDEVEVMSAIGDIVALYFGDLMEADGEGGEPQIADVKSQMADGERHISSVRSQMADGK